MKLFSAFFLILIGLFGMSSDIENYLSGTQALSEVMPGLTLGVCLFLNGILLYFFSKKHPNFSFLSKNGLIYILSFILIDFGFFGILNDLFSDKPEKMSGIILGISFVGMGLGLFRKADPVPSDPQSTSKFGGFFRLPRRKIKCESCGAMNSSEMERCEYCGNPI
ncbi:MAG: hypothetical protein H7A24_06635 [Leptospiraceae bacterium]|nr:hypothetical protein [Leptospiraceae bacterium]MCP5511538.1 hypothetical protein [Leptospiraceae bacterium]